MEITPFNFNGAELRTIANEGEPWFVAADVCKALEIKNITEALRAIDQDDLTSVSLNSGGQNREMKIINESGLYNLTFKSKVPKAKDFKKWVTAEVLPAIRKTGSYATVPVQFTLPTTMAEALRLAADTLDKLNLAETKLIEAAPKVAFHDTVTASNTVVTMDVAAKTAKLPYGNVTLFRKLREKGVLMSGGQRHNLPKQRFIDQGLFTVDEFKFEHNSGEPGVRFTTHVTQKGIAWIVKEFSHETAEKGAA